MPPMTAAPADDADAPTPQALIASARDCIPRLRELGPQHDAQRRLSDEAMHMLRTRGLYRIMQPTACGGYGMGPDVLWAVTREIARGDASTAWVFSLTGLHPWLVGAFEPRAQDDVFADGADAVVPVLSGGVARNVRVVADGDGWRVTGRWLYASGVDVATWLCVMLPLPAGEGSEPHLALVPQDQFRIDHDSWQVSGMRGTGSKDVSLHEVHVPGWRLLSWDDAQQGHYPGACRNHEAAYRMPLNGLFAMSTAAAVVGVAHGMLDLYREVVTQRFASAHASQQADDRFTHAAAGRASSDITMAYALLMHDLAEMQAQAAQGMPFDLVQRARYRVDAATISDTALAGAMRLVRNLGGAILPQGPIERCFRDLHAMASHFLLQADPAAELHGRLLLGLPLAPGSRL